MKRIIAIVLVAPFLLISCSSAQEEARHEKQRENAVQQEKKTVHQDKTKGIDFENAVFVDVRTPGEYASGTYEDAQNIPLNELEGRLNELDENDQIVVFCRSGGRASQALQILSQNGFTNVINGINTNNLETLQKQ